MKKLSLVLSVLLFVTKAGAWMECPKEDECVRSFDPRGMQNAMGQTATAMGLSIPSGATRVGTGGFMLNGSFYAIQPNGTAISRGSDGTTTTVSNSANGNATVTIAGNGYVVQVTGGVATITFSNGDGTVSTVTVNIASQEVIGQTDGSSSSSNSGSGGGRKPALQDDEEEDSGE